MAAPTIRGDTDTVNASSVTSPSSTAIGDLVLVFMFERAGVGVPTHTIVGGYTPLFSQAHDDGSTDGAFSGGYIVASTGGAQSYSAFTSSSGAPEWYTGCLVLTTGTYSTTGIVSTSTNGTTNAVPNPPSVAGLDSAKDYLFIALGAWHLGAAGFLTPTAMANYTLQGHAAGQLLGDVAYCTRDGTDLALTTEDPAAYTDNLAPNGTCAATVAIPEAPPVAGTGNPIPIFRESMKAMLRR